MPRGQPGPRAQPGRVPEPGDVADLGDDDRAEHRPDPGQFLDRAVGVVPGQQVSGHLLQHGDLAGQPAGQLPQRGDLPGVRLGQRELVQPPGSPGAEDVRAGHLDAELGQHAVDLVLAAGADMHQLAAVPRDLAQLADLRRGDPALRPRPTSRSAIRSPASSPAGSTRITRAWWPGCCWWIPVMNSRQRGSPGRAGLAAGSCVVSPGCDAAPGPGPGRLAAGGLNRPDARTRRRDRPRGTPRVRTGLPGDPAVVAGAAGGGPGDAHGGVHARRPART